MPTSIVVAAISTGIGYGLGYVTAATALGYFLTTAAMGIALNALAPKPNFGLGSSGYNLKGESGSALDHQVIYGEARVGGVRVYDASTGNKNEYLHRILAFAGHEVSDYSEIYINDELVTFTNGSPKYTVRLVEDVVYFTGNENPKETVTVYDITSNIDSYVVDDTLSESAYTSLESTAILKTKVSGGAYSDVSLREFISATITAKSVSGGDVITPERYVGKVRIKPYYGTPTQTADSDLIAETVDLVDGKWTTDHRLQGIAYLYIRFKFDADSFPNGVPSVSATIKGKKVYNPTTLETEWSDNPALCLRDYLTSDYGLDQPSDRIDDTLVSAALAICNQTVEGEKRYTCNGAFRTATEPSGIISDLLSSMGGLIWYGQGKWRMKASAWTTPTISFDEGDLRSGISLSTRHSRRDNFNSIKGKFRGPESEWQEADYPEVTDPAFLVADNNISNVLDFPLPFTSSSLTAQRIARVALNRNREQLTFTASFGMRAFQVQVGDFINITNQRFGWDNKPFEVTEWTLGLVDELDVQVTMTLREISESVFTEADGAVFELNNTTLPNVFTGLEINNLEVSGAGNTQGDGTFINSAILTWDAADNPFVSYYEVSWKPYTDSSYASTTTVENTIEISPLIDGVEYLLTVRAVTDLGNKGEPLGIFFIGGGDQTAPGTPTDLSSEGSLGFITLTWTNPVDTDFNYVEIWEGSDSVLANATNLSKAFGTTFNRGNLAPLTTKYYWIRSVDYSGNKSSFVGPSGPTTTTQIASGDIGPAVITYSDFATDVVTLFDEFQDQIDDRVTSSTLTDTVSDIQSLIDAKVPISDYNITVDYQQQLEDATNQLATDALTLALNAASLESRINDAGITVDPATGSVVIQGLATLENQLNQVSIDLDAAEGQISLKASTTYVNDAIAAATLPEATLASLDDLTARVSEAEIVIDSVETAITLSATDSFYNVNDATLGVVALEGRITVAEDEITLKASNAALDELGGRVTSAEITLGTLDVANISLTVQDVRSIAGKQEDLSNLTLEQVLGRYKDREYVLQDLAFARQSLTADVNDQKVALSSVKTELASQIDDNRATIVAEQQTRADEISAVASDITTLQATLVGDYTTTATLENSYYTKSATDSAISSAVLDLSSTVSGTYVTTATLVNGYYTTAEADSAISSAITTFNSEVLFPNYTATADLEATYYTQVDTDFVISSAITTFNTEVLGANYTTTADLELNYYTQSDTDTAISGAITTFNSDVVSANYTTTADLESGFYTKTDADTAISTAVNDLSVTVGNTYATLTETGLIEGDIDGIQAQYGVTIDNNGSISGFQILSQEDASSAFNVRADQFAVFNSDGAGGDNPFTIFTTDRTIGDVVYPAGTYIQDAYIDNAAIVDGSITNAKIGDTIQSTVYTQGVEGWKVEKDGTAEFNGVVLSRNLVVNSGSFVYSGNVNSGSTVLIPFVNTGIRLGTDDVWDNSKVALLAVARAVPNSAQDLGAAPLWRAKADIYNSFSWYGDNPWDATTGLQYPWSQDPASGTVRPSWSSGNRQRVLMDIELRTSLIRMNGPITIYWKVYQVT